MVNKTQFYKTKVALAVVLSLGLAACGDSDGDANTSNNSSQTDSTQNTVGNQDELSGTVQGVVVDSNANPLEGVKVYLGADETVTNAGGQYVFTNVAVTNVNGVNNEGDESDDDVTQTLVVTIAGTDAFLGALVTVTPEAQVNNTGGQGDADEDNGSNSQVTIQTFVDGFTAQAGTAVLPTLNAGAYGYIRHCETGQPLVDAADLLSFDFVSLSADVSTSVSGNGTQLTNAEDTHTVSSDADGMFTLTGLAANSTYTASAKKGWAITSGLGAPSVSTNTTVTTAVYGGVGDTTTDVTTSLVSGNTTTTTRTIVFSDDSADLATTTVIVTTSTSGVISTNSEGSSEFLNTIEVCPVEFVDADVTVAPWIKSIDGQIGNSEITANSVVYAALNQGVVNDFVVNFSEEMAATFDLTEARVKVIAPGTSLSVTIDDATVTLAADGESATVTFVTDLAEGSKVDVWFPHWTALDANDDLFLVDNSAIGYDSIGVTTTTKAVYSHAFFCTFNKPLNTASVVLGPQIFDADTTEDGNLTDLAGYSTAFQDNVVDAATAPGAITQLNDGDSLTSARLTALATARNANVANVTIDQDYAVVAFDGSNAASLVWESTTGTTTTTIIPAPVVAPVVATPGYTIVTKANGDTELHISIAKHSDVITATPVNGFGDVVATGAMTVTLVDAVAPTTVVQQGYEITSTGAPFAGLNVVSGTTANASFGSGGEISAPGTTATANGEPIIYIQPRHLAGVVGTTTTAARETEFDTLVVGMNGRLSSAELAAYATPALAQAAVSRYATAGGVQSPIYDATAFDAWEATTATIGVAFSENVTLTTTAPAYSGTASLVGGFAVNNDVAVTIDNTASLVDLVTFDTTDVVALSLDAGADLGFVGSVTDSRDNASTANAQVFVQDAFPPMVTDAVWNGETLVLTFNETPVIPSPAANINIIDPTNVAAAYPISVGSTNAAVTGNVMTITLTGTENVDVNSRFVSGTAGEFLYDDDADANEEQHAVLDWDVIEDETGNSWSDFNSTLAPTSLGLEGTPSVTRRWEVVAPRFLAVDSVGAFNYQLATTLFEDTGVPGDDDGIVTYTVTFSHPLELAAPANPLVVAITGGVGTTYDTPASRLGAISLSTIDAEGVATMNSVFDIDLDAADGVAPNGTFVLNAAILASEETKGSFTISADHKVVTLTLNAALTGVDAINFGGVNATTFGFATATNSAITGDTQLATPNIPWQNVN